MRYLWGREQQLRAARHDTVVGNMLLCRHRAAWSSSNTQHLIAEMLLYGGTVPKMLQCSCLQEPGKKQSMCQNTAVQRPHSGLYGTTLSGPDDAVQDARHKG